MSDERPPPPLPPELSALLRAERDDRPAPPSAEARQRLRARLRADRVTAPPPSRAELPRAAQGGKIGLAVAFAVGTVVGGLAVSIARGPEAPVPVVAPAPQAMPPPALRPPPLERPAATTSTPAPPLAQRPALRPAPRPSPPDPRDQALLEQARVALARGAPAEALEALRAHAAAFPKSDHAEEEEALFILALHAARDPAAQARAAAFFEKHPKSLFRQAIEDALED
ncbi:MAG: hypothetical protein U1E65_26555 [Myxococcota bacterium]